MIEVLPAPVAPTRATLRPGSTVNEMSRRMYWAGGGGGPGVAVP